MGRLQGKFVKGFQKPRKEYSSNNTQPLLNCIVSSLYKKIPGCRVHFSLSNMERSSAAARCLSILSSWSSFVPSSVSQSPTSLHCAISWCEDLRLKDCSYKFLRFHHFRRARCVISHQDLLWKAFQARRQEYYITAWGSDGRLRKTGTQYISDCRYSAFSLNTGFWIRLQEIQN